MKICSRTVLHQQKTHLRRSCRSITSYLRKAGHLVLKALKIMNKVQSPCKVTPFILLFIPSNASNQLWEVPLYLFPNSVITGWLKKWKLLFLSEICPAPFSNLSNRQIFKLPHNPRINALFKNRCSSFCSFFSPHPISRTISSHPFIVLLFSCPLHVVNRLNVY